MNNLKNDIIAYSKKNIWIWLTSKTSSYLVYKLFIKKGFLKTKYGKIYVGKQPNRSISLMFFGMYEREELRFIEKYIALNLPVVEFGASLGLTTSLINLKLKKTVKSIAVEADPTLCNYLNKTKKANDFNNLEIVSGAVDYSSATFIFFIK